MLQGSVILALKNYKKSEPINLGLGEEITICALAQKIKEFMKFNGKIIRDTMKPEGPLRRCLDNTRAKKDIGFKPRIKLEEVLEKQ